MNQQVCDLNRLSSFVRGELSPDDERELTAHLNECESCGEALEHQVAEASVWHEVSRLLGDAGFPDQDVDFSVRETRDSQIQQVLSQLSPTDDPDSLGRIGGYEVTGVVGSGGMGVVLKARDQSLDRVVAVKVMAPHLAASGSARQRFAREAKAAAAVLHPNVIAIHGVSNEQALPYLVMPYVRGESLQKRIDAEGPLPLVDILRIGAQVAAGLAAAHEQGLVHRDIKPGNILMEQGVERVTITDFGLARAVDDASMTRSGVIAGTPQYMSPEQARGEPIDHRSDLFSLGSLLYAMCTGHSPFRAETSFGVMHRIIQDSPRPLTEINPEIPVWLEGVVMKLLSKDAGDRFESAGEVAELLEGCLSHTQYPATTPLPESVVKSASKPSRNRWWPKFIAASVLLPLLLLAGVLIVLELNKGTLRIESEADDVPIRIVQGKEVFDELTVSKSGKAVRIAAGSYKIEIGGQIDGLALDDGSVTLQRGGNDVVRIVKVAAAASVLRSDRQPTDIVGKRSKAPQTRLKSEVHDNDRPLLAAVNEFNSSHKFNDQPPLTEDEVVACISWLLNHEEPPVSKSRPDLRLLVEQRQLPAGWAITATESSPMFGDDAASQLTINLEWTSEDRAIPIRQWAVSPPESFLEPTETATDENGIPLQAAISAFNASHHTINGIRQPPLTLKEVLAAIAIWKQKRNEAGVDDATFDNFKRIARTHYLPAEARFQVIPRFETSSGVYSIWSVTIVMPQVGKPEWTYAFSIRRQFTALNAELASQIHWGKPAENGLQAGFRLIPAQEVYRVGQVVDVEFLFRSIYGQAPVSLPNFFTHQEAHLRRSRTNDELEVIEDQQEKIVGGWISAGVTEEPIARKGQRIGFTDNPKADFKTKVGTKLIVSPTGSQLSLSFTVANPADGAEGQSLETGVVQFKVVADDLSQASREVTNGIDATASPVPVASTGNMSDESTKQSSSLARRKTVNNLTRIAIALHRYHELHGHLPPATILGKDGKGGPPHSWRVELLPLLGDQELYDQYHFDEPWESEHNKGLLAKMPDVYRSPLDKADSVNTSCFGVVSDDVSKRAAELAEMRDQAESGPDSEYAGEYGNDEPQPRYEQYTPEATVFWKQRGAAFIDMLDGTSNCIAVIEAKRDIPWTKPEDIAYSADHPLPNFGGWFEQGIHAAFADGMVKFLASYNDEQTIRNLLTISDGQFVEPLLVRRLQIHGAIAVPEDEPDVAAGPETYQVPGGPLLLIQSNKKSVLTEADIIEVAATTDPNNPSEGDIVAMTLTEEAGKRFLEATTKLSEQGTRGHMVITFDRKVVSAPRVLTPIGNKLTITGTIDAKKLAEQIQAAIDDIEAVDLTPSANAEDDDVAPIEELPQQEEAGTRSNTDEADAPANACKSETSEFEMRLTEQHGFLTAKQAVSLDDAVAAFNQLAGQSEVGRKQSKLTADEVIASIRNWIDRNAGKVATRKELQEVIETKTLQPGHQLSFTSRYISERHVFDVWEIRFGDKGSVAWLRIRDILLASRPKTPQEEELWKQIRAEMAKSFDHVRLGGLGVSRERSPGEQSRFEQLLDRAYQRSAGVSGTRSPNDEAALPKYRPHRATRRAQVEERIHEKLRQSTLKSIRKSPLDDVLKQLANFHDIKLIFDPLWLEDATPDREQPVSADLGELSLGAALDFILEPLGMSYIVREDEVRITSLERAASYQYERVHELPPPLKGREAEIIQALTTKISPEKWWRIGGEYVVSATDGCLTISANREVHEAAAALLEELQKPKQQQASPELESAWDEVNSQK